MTLNFRPARVIRLVLILLAVVLAVWAAKTYIWPDKPVQNFITSPVRKGDIEDTVLATGTLEAFKLVSVGSQVSGQLKSLKVELGQSVKAGQLVAEIDSTTQQNNVRNTEAALASARAQLQSAEVSLKQARLVFQRQKQLRDQDAISQADYESAEAAYESAQAAVNTSKAQVTQSEISADTARVNLGYTRITSVSYTHLTLPTKA